MAPRTRPGTSAMVVEIYRRRWAELSILDQAGGGEAASPVSSQLAQPNVVLATCPRFSLKIVSNAADAHHLNSTKRSLLWRLTDSYQSCMENAFSLSACFCWPYMRRNVVLSILI